MTAVILWWTSTNFQMQYCNWPWRGYTPANNLRGIINCSDLCFEVAHCVSKVCPPPLCSGYDRQLLLTRPCLWCYIKTIPRLRQVGGNHPWRDASTQTTAAEYKCCTIFNIMTYVNIQYIYTHIMCMWCSDNSVVIRHSRRTDVERASLSYSNTTSLSRWITV